MVQKEKKYVALCNLFFIPSECDFFGYTIDQTKINKLSRCEIRVANFIILVVQIQAKNISKQRARTSGKLELVTPPVAKTARCLSLTVSQANFDEKYLS